MRPRRCEPRPCSFPHRRVGAVAAALVFAAGVGWYCWSKWCATWLPRARHVLTQPTRCKQTAEAELIEADLPEVVQPQDCGAEAVGANATSDGPKDMLLVGARVLARRLCAVTCAHPCARRVLRVHGCSMQRAVHGLSPPEHVRDVRGDAGRVPHLQTTREAEDSLEAVLMSTSARCTVTVPAL